MSLLGRICRECDRSFKGGPRAYFCPDCRVERKRELWRRYVRNKRAGNVRTLGSTDKCERCGKDYTVKGGLQRFCPECQPIHAAEHDRRTSIEFYHENKERINPPRNERRRVGVRNCDWCGKEYRRTNRSLTCSDECRRLLRNKKWNEKYGPRYRNKNNPAQPQT